MPTPEEMLQAIAAQRLGPAKPAPTAAAAAAATNVQDPATAQAKAQMPTTPTEKAAAAAEPNSGGEDPAVEFIEWEEDGEKKQYTKQQLQSSLKRYKDLNYKWQSEHAPMKPVLELTSQIMERAKKAGYDAKPEEVAKFLQDAISAHLQGGNGQGGNKPASNANAKADQNAKATADDDDEVFSSWEKENAVKLPPGFREQGKALREMQGMMQQIMGFLAQQQQGSNGAAAQVQQQAAATQQAQVNVYQQTVDVNMQRAFQAAGIPPDAKNDFFMFAMARGYTPEDFIDPELTATVANDYKANKDAPEVARLREVAKRRQAFTGAAEGAPGGGSAPAAPPADPMLAQLISRNMR